MHPLILILIDNHYYLSRSSHPFSICTSYACRFFQTYILGPTTNFGTPSSSTLASFGCGLDSFFLNFIIAHVIFLGTQNFGTCSPPTSFLDDYYHYSYYYHGIV